MKKSAVLIHSLACITGALLVAGHASAQGSSPLNLKLRDIIKPGSSKEWMSFKEGALKNPASIFKDLKDAFELSREDDMNLEKVKKDQFGFTHYRYQQYYKNRKVLYGEYIIHQRADSFIKSANGRIIAGLSSGNNNSIDEKTALKVALQFLGAKRYLWQNTEMERELKRQKKNPNATYYPKGELLYAPLNYDGNFKASNYRLAWQFNIHTQDPEVTAKAVYVDALTGKIIHYTDIAMQCSGNSGTSAFNGNVSFNTDFNGNVYFSHNDCQSADIYIYDCKVGDAATNFYTNTGNIWAQQSAVQAQWGALMTYNYYNTVHDRKSWDGESGDMIVYNNAAYNSPPDSNNACWGCRGDAAIFGAGSTAAPTDDWNTDDIMGHEFTHGVNQATAGLIYNKESGALSESFSDIFGEMIESWAEGNCDYRVGNDRGAIRSLMNPKVFGDPDTYLKTNWKSTAGCSPSKPNDNCGVHTNSGVQNHWFYLLSEGGSGTNDLGVSYHVTGITRFKARLIAYRALTEYLSSSSQYIDARKASLEAAEDLFGSCSPEIIAVGNAWQAVGVEPQSPEFIKNICGSFPSSGTFFQAISALTAANGCNTEITPSSSTVYFTARDQVILSPGFKAADGSNFVAYLDPCASTLRKASKAEHLQIPMSDTEKGIKSTPVQQKELPKELTKEVIIAVSPNPFRTGFTLSVNAKQNEKAQIIIYNALGIKVREQMRSNLNRGTNTLSFPDLKLSKGVYMIAVIMNGVKTVMKVVKL